ncbi:hypothetical protein GCM10011571_35000 [Marinithermofilum abyssi]|uniref:CobW C-terminal domain-containing protein n=1 Tax=Marinithermofilum abyssi TaxID=1571185 RepID=A0A8J2YFP5_9BACL|nr:hypothetical protein GCM10011571_35000 [Marinithermofilum abyssi]
MLLLNKCDLVAEEDLIQLEKLFRKLQPDAKIIRTVHGQVEPAEILNTGRFDFEKASQSAGWLQELLKGGEHTPETEEYGISSLVYQRRRPFHPERLTKWMEEWPETVVRAKGVVWLASRNQMAMSLSQAGPSIQIGPIAYWVASLPEEEQQEVFREQPEVKEEWDPAWGDRMTQLVLIGIDMDRDALIRSLDDCLLSDEEMKEDWSRFSDPLPKGEREEWRAEAVQ